ncbi:hypothetical protein Pelo_9864 [Pelomyxa schiedti]|nr:hypothetical protein Pelo_9864 [Pelomyxa schiedti]
MMIGLSVMLKGTDKDKLHFIFRIFASGRSGSIEKERLKRILGVGGLFKLIKQKRAITIEEYVDSIFASLDTDRDGKITETDFMQVLKEEPSLVTLFFDPKIPESTTTRTTSSSTSDDCSLM